MPGRSRRRHGRKQLPARMALGQLGINLIERVVLEMECRWQPTVGIDAGIDGIIELSDQSDPPHPLGLFLHVQSRATDRPWPNEKPQRFTYIASEDDLEYWLQGNAPVLLIVSRPRTNEAYWVSIKDYFRDAATRRTRQIVFDKSNDVFSKASYDALFTLGRERGRRDSGLYLGPPRLKETLITNLLPVEHFGPGLFVAETNHRTREEVFAALRAAGAEPGGAFIPVGKSLISPYDLRDDPWPRVCDRGTVEEFAAEEWGLSEDPDRQREYARLLRLSLSDMLYPQVRFFPEKNVLAFATFGEERVRRYPFMVEGRKRRPSVVRVYKWTWEDQTYLRYRQLAMRTAFRRAGDRWYLEITPTYLYTRDGRQIDSNHEQLLSGIKRLERQPAVFAQLQLWQALLLQPRDIFRGIYPYLAFGELAKVESEFGIIDQAWKTWDEAPREADVEGAPELLPERLWN